MLKTLVVYVHLIAACAAIGTIIITDVRLLAKALRYRVVISPPAPLQTRIITLALAVLYVTGAACIWMGSAVDPDYLANNPKLQAKIMLVVLLTLNAVVLHKRVIPILQRGRPVSRWLWRHEATVALSASLSNSMWFYAAFLGIARVWNGTVSLGYVLSVGLVAWASMCIAVQAVLVLASRDAPKAKPDWIDSAKASLGEWVGVRQR